MKRVNRYRDELFVEWLQRHQLKHTPETLEAYRNAEHVAAVLYVPCATTASFTRKLLAADAILDEHTDERGGVLHYWCDPVKFEDVQQAMRKEARS